MNKIKLISLLLITVLMVACQEKDSGKLDDRVLAFWSFKINKDFKGAYQYLSPGWKKTETVESFTMRMLQSRIKWLESNVKSKKCSAKFLCTVEVGIKYEYRFRGVGSEKMVVESSLSENWMMKDNIWYNIPIKKS